MKKVLANLLFLGLAAGVFAQGKPAPVAQLKTAKDSASFAFGMVQAQRLKAQLTEDYDVNLFIEGLRAMLRGDSTPIRSTDAMRCQATYGNAIQLRYAEKNKAEGKAFLEKNKTRKEVTVTPSGLQYLVMKKGTGTVHPKASDKVKVHYHGTLTNGEVFDSSVDRGQPIVFGLDQVIKGWTEGVQLMVVGDKYKFVLPYDIAYGERAAGPKIKPFSTLQFEVELIDINPDAKAPAPAPTPAKPGN